MAPKNAELTSGEIAKRLGRKVDKNVGPDSCRQSVGLNYVSGATHPIINMSPFEKRAAAVIWRPSQ